MFNDECNMSQTFVENCRMNMSQIPIDETLKHLDLGYGIIIDYHYPIPLENWIGAIFIIGGIILLKKWRIKEDKENEELEPDDLGFL